MEAPKQTIFDWMLALMRDEERFERYLSAPREVLEDPAEELTEAQRSVLLSRDLDTIRHVIEYELGLDAESSAYAILVFAMPSHTLPSHTGPPPLPSHTDPRPPDQQSP